MKRCLLFLLASAALALPSLGQVTLELVPTSATPMVGVPFTLDIEVYDVGSTVSLDSYEFTLLTQTSPGGATTTNLGTATFALPAALASTFTLAGTSGDTGGAYADASPGDDLTITSTPTPILTATFTPATTGSYQVEFASPPSGSQNLYSYSSVTKTSSPIGYTPLGATFVIAPEPSVTVLMLVGVALLATLASVGELRTRLSLVRNS